ncbi:hypothetical protein DC347_05535 [Pseudarthrobacter sp. AG30]|uniref:neutral zinc metallopeptidase n=1 Tax=Pseudarthrobacter sp. AG30 TaxID=2249742 RepID=UPI000D649BCE|nr:neutral zinc metallopeptidase [Pseudarthrobacter sp. AG30]RAX18171.1 hypothetical protein DC347_05535 [Pseudarthrobacter sp. AG30]
MNSLPRKIAKFLSMTAFFALVISGCSSQPATPANQGPPAGPATSAALTTDSATIPATITAQPQFETPTPAATPTAQRQTVTPTAQPPTATATVSCSSTDRLNPGHCIESDPLGDAPLGAAPPQSQVIPGSDYSYTVEQYLNFVMDDVGNQWAKWFPSVGLPQPSVYFILIEPNTTTTSKCFTVPLTSDHPNSYYCPKDSDSQHDGTIILPVTTFQKMWTGDVFERNSKTKGDFAAAILVAHEFGHHVQNAIQLGYNKLHPESPISAAPQGKNIELIADCFAGNWMATAYYEGLLEPGDYEEAIAGLESIGDTLPGGTAPHGSADERKAALLTGYNGTAETKSGDPLACISTYWK